MIDLQVSGPLFPLFVLIWPLVLGLAASLPSVRSNAIVLLPLAPLPALVLAVVGPLNIPTEAGILLLGVTLNLDINGTLFLGAISGLWCLGGIFALGYMRMTPNPAVFAGFWCLTLSGNLGVVLSQDAGSFYVSFAAVSLAAYFLVVHERTERALYAGRIYIFLAVVGEALLLIGLLIGVDAANSMSIAKIRVALADAPQAGWAVFCLIGGLGIKAGLVPLHVWLPLAHPAAPTPASAVLSGAIVKAGIIGFIQFLPDGTALWPSMLLVLGLAGTYGAVFLGLGQTNPKAILAYSTISQMGLVIAVIGVGHLTGNTVAAYGAAALYCAHHGLAKGALFMSVGMVGKSGRTFMPFVLFVTGLMAASIAGAPFAGGALAKSAIKTLFEDWALLLVTLSGAGTTLLLARFLMTIASNHGPEPDKRPSALMSVPWFVAVVAALLVPWVLVDRYSDLSVPYLLSTGALWDASWPVALGLVCFFVGLRLLPGGFRVAEGDIAGPLVKSVAAVKRMLAAVPEPTVPTIKGLDHIVSASRTQAAERRLLQLAPICVAALILAMLMFANI
ncbi:complex I subunit 5 family protein [Pelagibacterium lentulum]|uniref:NADH:quinone oxidoreductase/Mrp antiporter transmembrane domain-containing protein n=1 Tax=Pelagibacterium lentulum TaxID=2029865 RepID=A0A916W2D7_9HYPH|nr:proton-conducting transporter membrane subunit [Pelagibacterium lentulum]GGA61946.1 hypothetical protein GCM10011499_35310 [Pelagibacterium lentulum]